MPALNAMVAKVEKALLMLAQTIVVLTVRGVEGCGNSVAGICFLLMTCVCRGRLGPVGKHGPAPHSQQRFA